MKDRPDLIPAAGPAEPYSNFAEMQKSEVEGRDFIRHWQDRGSPVAIVAPHGGGIEPGTSEIAVALAGEDYSYYCFESLKTNGNEIMHITSHDFDDPICTSLARRARIVVTIHGCGGEEEVVFVGGRHNQLRHQMLACLTEAGFEASSDEGRYPGKHVENICNIGISGSGLQLEISLGLRRKMFSGMSRTERRITRPAFNRFVKAVRKVLEINTYQIDQAARD